MENNIGEARRRYASKVGKFTQEDAAEYFGVSLSTYKKWEQGQGMMNGEQLRAIARKYDVTTDFLLQITPKTAQPEPPAPAVDLTPDERELLALFRRSDEKGQSTILDTARAFAALSEKDGEGVREDVGRAERAVR